MLCYLIQLQILEILIQKVMNMDGVQKKQQKNHDRKQQIQQMPMKKKSILLQEQRNLITQSQKQFSNQGFISFLWLKEKPYYYFLNRTQMHFGYMQTLGRLRHEGNLSACITKRTSQFRRTQISHYVNLISREQTLLVSLIHLHNEIGVIQNMKEIGNICRSNNVFFHSDAAQSFGKIPIDVNDMNIDCLSISSHKVHQISKIYGPKGIGAMFIRRKPKVRIIPQINGGGQERGLRSGTLSPALCVGFGKAAEVAQYEMENDQRHIQKLSDKIKRELNSRIPCITLNGSETERYYGNLNFSFNYVEGESMIMAIKQMAVSSGSACTSASLEPSYVLRSLGVNEENAHSSIRIGLGRFTTEEEVDYAIQKIVTSINRLRDLSPLWEMVQEGINLDEIQWSQPH